MMICKDCRNKVYSWEEVCPRCGAELGKNRNEKREANLPMMGFVKTHLGRL
ncbi:MAG TPA: hypothetical protein GX391_03645 [Firmicutes bacterium]|jgi:predicted amidophosphoribosyltransferase|nr:hypothetical protein [Bacillota bacterium]HOQ24274.1 hypothetical protein [Bacillota bacterium]HPT66482.1 hypothetical protein [Bacillota bacterium]